jgi:leucyl aminopeptidase
VEFKVGGGVLAGRRTGCIVAGVYEGGKLSPSAAGLDAASRGALAAVMKQGDLDAELGTTLLLHGVERIAAERVLLVGLGPEDEFLETSYRTAVCAAARALRGTGAADATFCLHELPVNGRDLPWKIEHAVLEVMEGVYRFDQLKSKPPRSRRALRQAMFHAGNRNEMSAARAAIDRGAAIGEGITLAKDLANLPANICTPAYLAGRARELGKRHGFGVSVVERAQAAKLGMNSFLAVARGSAQPPKFIVMRYEGGAKGSAPVVLVGKGLTFDAGGISIKAAREMDEMKFDMCGAATVLGAMHAAALMKLPLNVVAIIPAAENMPDGNAIKPGDIVTTMSGQTVEILDTDAEGRLVLCDALTYAERFAPSAVIDLGTLTGGIVVALGDQASGLFCNDDALAREVVQAGDRAWDRAWQMPLWVEYQDALKSNFADFPNMGTDSDCAITAACFLSRFARRYPWAHLDIAGTASRSGAHKGATGRPVGLLAHFLARRAQA